MEVTMGKIGRFTDEAARQEYLRTYRGLEALWPVPAEQADVPTRFGTTHVRWSGAGGGTPLVLVHGLNGNGLSWYRDVETLARGRVTYAPDTIGTAGLSVQTAPVGESDVATWFAETLDGLGLDRVHVMGESNGAWHATLAALGAPQRVASLTLVEPNGVFVRTPWRSLLRFVRLASRLTEAGWRAMGEWLTPGVTIGHEDHAVARAAFGYRRALGWARVLTDAELASLTVPVLALFGGASVLSAPEASARRIDERVPGAETHVYPGRGHGVLGELRDEVLTRVVEFLERHDEGHGPGVTEARPTMVPPTSATRNVAGTRPTGRSTPPCSSAKWAR
ncbi:alpha/beta fold hydrolase [Cellulomonas sp. NPDC057328]|uniref:alpha/beta fold hydrolase n=1 Tax=Cellulomonas sp. NPDC057328 TaxID=3346101 RepID=UPI003625FADF